MPKAGALYVVQKDFAIIPGGDTKVSMVASGEATTSHIVVLYHRKSGGVVLARFDGVSDDEFYLVLMVRTLLEGFEDRSVDVYAVGGFYDQYSPTKGTKESLDLSNKLLRRMIEMKTCTFNIIQWCCCELNTIEKAKGMVLPVLNGLIWDRNEQQAYPAVFHYRGPDFILRCVATFLTTIRL